LTPAQIDYVAFYEKPLAKFDRLLESYIAHAPKGFRSFCQAMPVWLKEKLHLPRIIRRNLPSLKGQIVFIDHHESHAASAFLPSPFERAAILTLDGVGEWSTTTRGSGVANRITLTDHLQFPHSLGLLYSAFTYHCGFRVNSGEYKLMGLAPYGRPTFVDTIYTYLIDLKPDGSFWLNMDYFNYCHGLTMTNRRFDQLFGGPPRQPESTLLKQHMDLAASIQAVTEEIVLRLSRDLHQRTGMKHLVMAGGVALNCVANGRLLREGPFEDVWIQPAAGDAGGALGAALFVWHQLLEKPRKLVSLDSQQGSLLGPRFSAGEIGRFLDKQERPFREFSDETELLEYVAHLLANGKVVGWFQGRMEYGPRALGTRSILGDPRAPGMQAQMNLKIKFRESFRPFAPAVLREYANEWFDLPPEIESPYMLLVALVRQEHRVPISRRQKAVMNDDPDLRNRVNILRSTVPAITHIDYSARVQTVDEKRNPRFYRLLQEFHRLTGCPMLVNTSFNVRGEPIVCTPEDAYRCFESTEMDVLVMESFVMEKEADGHSVTAMAEHLAHFQLD
jgi:carbamoyltransferase